MKKIIDNIHMCIPVLGIAFILVMALAALVMMWVLVISVVTGGC